MKTAASNYETEIAIATVLVRAGLMLIPPKDAPNPSSSDSPRFEAVIGMHEPPCRSHSSNVGSSSIRSSSSSSSSSSSIATAAHSRYTPCMYSPERGSLKGSKGKKVCKSSGRALPGATPANTGYGARLFASRMEKQYVKSVACAMRAN